MNNKPYYVLPFLGIALLFLSACASVEKEDKTIPEGPYMGIVPTKTPKLLAPGFLDSPLEEFNGTFSPEGTAFYYTSVIQENFPKGLITFTHLQENNSWSAPAVAEFSGTYDDYDPIFSPDGSRLYFSSRRPVHDSLPKLKSNIWYLERSETGWTEPQPLIFTERNDYYSSLTRGGVIYFNTWSTGNLLKAIPENGSYRVQELDTLINQPYNQGDPFVSPDEDYLIFRGYGDDSLGRGDLYISFNINEQWTIPENLGAPINSQAHEMCPYVSADGRFFIFASGRLTESYNTKALTPLGGIQEKFRSGDNGELNLFYMSTDFIEELRKKQLSDN